MGCVCFPCIMCVRAAQCVDRAPALMSQHWQEHRRNRPACRHDRAMPHGHHWRAQGHPGSADKGAAACHKKQAGTTPTHFPHQALCLQPPIGTLDLIAKIAYGEHATGVNPINRLSRIVAQIACAAHRAMQVRQTHRRRSTGFAPCRGAPACEVVQASKCRCR